VSNDYVDRASGQAHQEHEIALVQAGEVGLGERRQGVDSAVVASRMWWRRCHCQAKTEQRLELDGDLAGESRWPII
jgi:hypothetical protein